MAFNNKLNPKILLPSRKSFSLLQIAVLLMAMLIPLSVSAAQLENRSLQLSTAAASATGVDYTFTFDVASSDNLGSFVFEICSNDPFPNTSCTAPAGFDGDSATATVEIDGTPATVDSVNTSGANDNVFDVLLNSVETVNASDTIIVVISGVTNPEDHNTEYWARIYTHANTAASSEVDNGGLAFSTGRTIDVTARVQETLSFCVYTGVNCAAQGNLVDLGILNTAALQTEDSFFDVATNARNGVIVQYLGNTLESGPFDITAFNGGDGGLAASNPGTEQFGLRVEDVTTGGQNAVAAAPFNTAAANEYAFFVNNLQSLATSSGPVETTTFTIRFGANVAPLTETGVYNTQIDFIATATF